MLHWRRSYLVQILAVLTAILVPLWLFFPAAHGDRDDPWRQMPTVATHTDHRDLLSGSFADGPAVTEACLVCHPDAANQVMHTAHWTWESPPSILPGRSEPVVLGKKNALNNFCIGITGNWPACTTCHVGYGWVDQTFDFTAQDHVDCLACHDGSGQYAKGKGGLPAEGVDLLAAARSVTRPSRTTCGSCHFRGGGGNAVKHGDLDESLYYPDESLDVHMGSHDFQCVDCHRTKDHEIGGRAISVSVDGANQVACTDCHDTGLHKDQRITAHLPTVACQTCHIPYEALKTATKTNWDWSTAGQDLPQNPHEYLKIKGSFVYERHLRPQYAWYNGKGDHYVLGDTMDPTDTTDVSRPLGSIEDPSARIWPFKVHLAKQIYDTEYNTLIQPKTYGEGGYWTEFDWDQAARLGMQAVNQPYSGHFGFANTRMYWPTTHMVASREKALQCVECHAEHGQGRLDWIALGYAGDPIHYGSRPARSERGQK